MNKNAIFSTERAVDREEGKQIHPVWRGIGLVMIVFIPIISFVAATLVLQYNSTKNWFPVPAEFIVNWPQDPLILMKLFLTIVIGFLIYAVFLIITFFTHTLFGPQKEKNLEQRHRLKKSR